MTTVQLSKIQLRRGLATDLPGAPTSTMPLAFSPGLDDGELGFTTDTGRLFLGQVSPTDGLVNDQRADFPYQNIEVVTENSPASVLQPWLSDNQGGFFLCEPFAGDSTFHNVQVVQPSGPVTFNLDLPVSGVNCIITYFVFDSSNLALRQGVMNVMWNSGYVGAPMFIDTGVFPSGSHFDLVFATAVIGSGPSLHVVLQAKNNTANPMTMSFRIDRPVLG